MFAVATSLTHLWKFCQVILLARLLPTPRACIDSTCTWCHSDVTPPCVPSTVRDLPWLHLIHRLLLCLAALWVWPMPSWVWLVSICFFLFFLCHACGAISFPNSVLKCYSSLLAGLAITTAMTSFLPIFGSTPQLHHPPVRPSLTSTLSFSACFLISLVWRTRPWVFQWTHGFAVVGMALQLQPVSHPVCALLLPP
jgi:hypothetical protein